MRKSAKYNVSAKIGRRSSREIGNRLALAGDFFVCIGRLHYLVRSRSVPGEWHCIDLEPVDGEDGGCTCTSYRVRGTCRHYRAVAKHLGLRTPDSF